MEITIKRPTYMNMLYMKVLYMAHIGVDSARRACEWRRGRGGAREAAARGFRRSVPAACSARRCPARKSPMHALCRRTYVSGRVPLGIFHSYIVILSNDRVRRPDNSRATLEFSGKTQPRSLSISARRS